MPVLTVRDLLRWWYGAFKIASPMRESIGFEEVVELGSYPSSME